MPSQKYSIFLFSPYLGPAYTFCFWQRGSGQSLYGLLIHLIAEVGVAYVDTDFGIFLKNLDKIWEIVVFGVIWGASSLDSCLRRNDSGGQVRKIRLRRASKGTPQGAARQKVWPVNLGAAMRSSVNGYNQFFCGLLAFMS